MKKTILVLAANPVDTSRLRLEFDVTKFPAQDNYLLKEFPEQLQFFNDGVPSRVLNGNDLEIQLDMRSMTEEVARGSEMPVMEYRLGGSTSWIPLALAGGDSRYFARLPVVSGESKASLRISLVDAQKGVKLVQTLEDIFVLGHGASGEVIMPPRFEPLPRLTVEATALQTPYSLPPVFAQDTKDGQIAAVTTDLGPYSIGAHVIRWQATNSAGKKSIGLQTLEMRDTIAPVINAPANITVTATGNLTEIPVPNVTAHDLVDGDLYTWTVDWKPFPVGTSYVIWNARDSSFNLSHVMQTITVVAASTSSQSSA